MRSQTAERLVMNPSRTGIRGYVAASAFLAAGAAYLAFGHSPHFSWVSALGFGALAFTAAQFPVSLSTGALYDISFVITIAALVAAGPGEAAIATAFATVSLREA